MAIGRWLSEARRAGPIGSLRAAAGPPDSTLRQVLRLALPATAEQTLNMMVGLVDTFLVGHIGASSLAAVGLANQWVQLATTLFAAISVGSTALIARAVGAKDPDLAERTLRQSVLLATVIGLASTVLGVTLAGPAMAVLGAEPEAAALGAHYLVIVSSVIVLSTIMFACMASMRGAGDTRTPMWIMLVVNAINVVLSYVLINGALGLPRMGVAGSAVGAAVARSLGGLICVVVLLKGRSRIRLRLHSLRPDWDVIRRVLRVGIPTGVEQLLFRFAMMAYVRTVASLGTDAYAAHQVALNAESLSYMPGFGFQAAAITLVGQCLGARNTKQAEKSGYMSFALGALLMGGMGLIFVAFARPLVSVFTSDPAVIALGVAPLRIVGIVQPLMASGMIFFGGLRGAGDTRYPMIVTGLAAWGVRVPLAVLFTTVFHWGLAGAWTAMSLDWCVRGLFAFVRFRRGAWKMVDI
jgi:multidrug resistance protein, MATE family